MLSLFWYVVVNTQGCVITTKRFVSLFEIYARYMGVGWCLGDHISQNEHSFRGVYMTAFRSVIRGWGVSKSKKIA